MRSLNARLEDGYCSITVANHRLIAVIRFVVKNYTHPWNFFANKFRLVLYAFEILFSGITCDSCDRGIKQGPCRRGQTNWSVYNAPEPWAHEAECRHVTPKIWPRSRRVSIATAPFLYLSPACPHRDNLPHLPVLHATWAAFGLGGKKFGEIFHIS